MECNNVLRAVSFVFVQRGDNIMIEKQLWSLWNESFFAQTFDRRSDADLIKFSMQFASTDTHRTTGNDASRCIKHTNANFIGPGFGNGQCCIVTMSILCQR